MTGYCAWFNVGGNAWVERHSSIASVKNELRRIHAAIGWTTPSDTSVVDLFDQCSDCNEFGCFHDYPLMRFAVGPRGGVREEVV